MGAVRRYALADIATEAHRAQHRLRLLRGGLDVDPIEDAGRKHGWSKVAAGGRAHGSAPGVATAAFSPPSLSGLLLWANNDTLVAGTPATWADSSGNGNTLTTHASPPVATDAQYAGRLSMAFTAASSQYLTSPSLTYGPFTIFTVAKFTGAAGVIWQRNPAPTDYLFATTGNTINVTRSGVTSAHNLSANWGIGTTPRTLVESFDGTHVGHTLTINGAGQTLSNVTAGDPGTATGANVMFVMTNQALNTFCNGTLGEFIVYNRALAAAEQASVEQYLRGKFGHY